MTKRIIDMMKGLTGNAVANWRFKGTHASGQRALRPSKIMVFAAPHKDLFWRILMDYIKYVMAKGHDI
jgi:hypothetical protein